MQYGQDTRITMDEFFQWALSAYMARRATEQYNPPGGAVRPASPAPAAARSKPRTTRKPVHTVTPAVAAMKPPSPKRPPSPKPTPTRAPTYKQPEPRVALDYSPRTTPAIQNTDPTPMEAAYKRPRGPTLAGPGRKRGKGYAVELTPMQAAYEMGY